MRRITSVRGIAASPLVFERKLTYLFTNRNLTSRLRREALGGKEKPLDSKDEGGLFCLKREKPNRNKSAIMRF